MSLLPPKLVSSHTTYTLFLNAAILGFVDWPVLSLKFAVTFPKVAPLFPLLARSMSLLLPPELVSSHTTYTFFPDANICGFVDSPVCLLKFAVTFPKVAPLFSLLARSMSLFLSVVSSHTTYTFFPDANICGFVDSPVLLLRFVTFPKVAPLSVLLVKSMSLLPPELVSSHTTYTLFLNAAILGFVDSPVLLLTFGVTFPKVAPLFPLLAKSMSLLPPEVVSSHTTYTSLPEVATFCSLEVPELLLRFLVNITGLAGGIVLFMLGVV